MTWPAPPGTASAIALIAKDANARRQANENEYADAILAMFNMVDLNTKSPRRVLNSKILYLEGAQSSSDVTG